MQSKGIGKINNIATLSKFSYINKKLFSWITKFFYSHRNGSDCSFFYLTREYEKVIIFLIPLSKVVFYIRIEKENIVLFPNNVYTNIYLWNLSILCTQRKAHIKRSFTCRSNIHTPDLKSNTVKFLLYSDL